MHLKSLSLDGYNHIMDLGAGAYGVASMIESKDGGQTFICKIVDLKSMKTQEREKALREFRIQDQLDHDCIIKFERKGTLIEPGVRI